jgi:hypothetical protein
VQLAIGFQKGNRFADQSVLFAGASDDAQQVGGEIAGASFSASAACSAS